MISMTDQQSKEKDVSTRFSLHQGHSVDRCWLIISHYFITGNSYQAPGIYRRNHKVVTMRLIHINDLSRALFRVSNLFQTCSYA